MLSNIISRIVAHKAAIALGGAMVGTVAVAILATKDRDKHIDNMAGEAALLVDDITVISDEDRELVKSEEMDLCDIYDKYTTKKTKAIIFAKSYWRTGMAMAVTMGLMVFSHVSMAKELAATAAALGLMSTKYKELAATLKEKYPDTYDKVMKTINEKNARKDISKKGLQKEETYDGRERYYEPITRQTFFAKPSQIFDAERNITDKFINDGVATIGDLILYLKEFADPKLHYDYEYDKIGWSPFDDTFDYNNSSYTKEKYSFVKITPSEKAQLIVDGEKVNVRTLLYSVYPYEEPGSESIGA